MEKTESPLEKLAEEWASKLKACQYVGEIIVPEGELATIAKVLNRDLYSPRENLQSSRICLLVLAINCMYYNHNEHGFWVHFCNLLGINDSQQSQSWIGKKLETELLRLGFLANRLKGPFRFVSPLREQCGITRDEISRYAALLNQLVESYGWEGIFVQGREEFSDTVRSHCHGTHLTQFLLDEQGWLFTKDVIRSISQYRRNLIDHRQLAQLPGFRTGFFPDLLDALEEIPQYSGKRFTRPPLPRLVFLPDRRQIAIAFDLENRNYGLYRFNGEIVRRTYIPLESQDIFAKKTITGERKNSRNEWEPWSIKGWLQSQSRYALFHPEIGYTDHINGISTGRYYFLSPFEDPPPSNLQLNSYGMIDLPFVDSDYDAWLLWIDETSDLGFLGITEKPRIDARNLISWADESNRISGTYELEKITAVQNNPKRADALC